MPRRLVALSASAVTAIYAAGLLSTHAAADSVSAAVLATQSPVGVATQVSTVSAAPSVALAATSPTTTTTPTTVAASATSTPVTTLAASTSTATPAVTSTVSAASSAAVASTYKDGTYAGSGTSRFGDVTVSVTTAGGKITSVQITKVTTKYPASRIASLPAQVVYAQTASVNVVTGATYSSQAFKQAVQQALLQAVA